MNPNDPNQSYTPPPMPPQPPQPPQPGQQPPVQPLPQMTDYLGDVHTPEQVNSPLQQPPLPTPPYTPPEPQSFDQYRQQQGEYGPPGSRPGNYQSPPYQPQYPPSATVPTPGPGQGSVPPVPSGQPMSPPQYFESEQQPGGKKKWFIIGGIIAAVLVVLLIVFFLVRNTNSDLSKSRKISNDFVAAVNKKDGHKAYTLLTEAARQGTKESDYAPFIVASGDKLQGKFSETKHEIQPGKDETRAYFLYEFPTAAHKYARTIIQKKDGKWGVISFVHSSSQLELVPGGTSASVNTGGAAK